MCNQYLTSKSPLLNSYILLITFPSQRFGLSYQVAAAMAQDCTHLHMDATYLPASLLFRVANFWGPAVSGI